MLQLPLQAASSTQPRSTVCTLTPPRGLRMVSTGAGGGRHRPLLATALRAAQPPLEAPARRAEPRNATPPTRRPCLGVHRRARGRRAGARQRVVEPRGGRRAALALLLCGRHLGGRRQLRAARRAPAGRRTCHGRVLARGARDASRGTCCASRATREGTPRGMCVCTAAAPPASRRLAPPCRQRTCGARRGRVGDCRGTRRGERRLLVAASPRGLLRSDSLRI